MVSTCPFIIIIFIIIIIIIIIIIPYEFVTPARDGGLLVEFAWK